MSFCPETDRVQDFLDGDLDPIETGRFRAHLARCETCAAELALYQRVIASVAEAPLFDPGPALTERVLDHVLPSRIRRRWMRRFGVGYAAALIATSGALILLAGNPAPRESLVALSGAAFRGLVQGLTLALHATSFVAIRLAEGWGLVNALGERLAPLGRALAALFSHGAVSASCIVAIVACALLLGWMRSKESRSSRGVPHVGLLGI